MENQNQAVQKTSKQKRWLTSLAENEEAFLTIYNQPPGDLIRKGTHVSGIDSSIARQIVTKKLNEVIDYVDAKRTIKTSGQMISSVKEILTFCQTYNIEEIIYVLHKLEMGHFGKFYERLQMPEIIEAFRTYEIESRIDVVEQMNLGDIDKNETSIKEIPEFKERFQKHQGTIERNKLKAFSEEASKTIKKAERRKYLLAVEKLIDKVEKGESLDHDEQEFFDRAMMVKDDTEK